MNKKSYGTAFRLIISDLKEILSYIEPVDANLTTYSHRIYELYLRTCTEFESICKDMLIEKKYRGEPSRYTIVDYKKLYDPEKFYKVGLLYWHPNTGVIEPFKNWEINNSLPWYSSYNSVKHNRNRNFAEANMSNLIHSIGALFTILHLNNCLAGSMRFDMSYEEQASITNYYDYLHSHFQKDKITRVHPEEKLNINKL